MSKIINFASKLIRSAIAGENLNNIFKFNGGVHPNDHKSESTILPIAKLQIPEKIILPLRQHVGNIPKITVKIGDYVLKGQILAEPESLMSAAIHASTSGTITAISQEVIPHPSGLPDMCITISCDGKDTWLKSERTDWRNISSQELVNRLRLSGIVGLGGATFPTHIKLRTNGTSNIHTLVINAAECEPYITCDDMLMREHADEIIKGIEIVRHILGAEKCLIGIEDNKPLAINAMTISSRQLSQTSVTVVPTLYPSGDARRLIHLLTGTEIPNDKRSTDVGIQVFNVATVMAVYRYFEFGEPSVCRVVTMTGNVTHPQNFEVLFGTPLNVLVAAAGGTKSGTTHFIMGGPMMGFDLPNDQVPITKATNCIIAATDDLFSPVPAAMPCIRCVRCADACPVNLQPQELFWFAKSDNYEKARNYNLFDCIECGCCTYVCPSKIPLVQYYRYAKSEIIALDKAKEAADLARERNEFRLERIEREKLERAKKHLERAQSVKSNEIPPTKNFTGSQKSLMGTLANNEESTQEFSSKKAMIEEAIARAKALKLSTSTNLKHLSDSENTLTKSEDENQAKVLASEINLDKKALIAAAIERAKAQKLAATEAGIIPQNIGNNNTEVTARIKEIDALREKAKQIK